MAACKTTTIIFHIINNNVITISNKEEEIIIISIVVGFIFLCIYHLFFYKIPSYIYGNRKYYYKPFNNILQIWAYTDKI